jgi:hypothetical protein
MPLTQSKQNTTIHTFPPSFQRLTAHHPSHPKTSTGPEEEPVVRLHPEGLHQGAARVPARLRPEGAVHGGHGAQSGEGGGDEVVGLLAGRCLFLLHLVRCMDSVVGLAAAVWVVGRSLSVPLPSLFTERACLR